MPITAPARDWWSVPVGRHEKIWLSIVVPLGLLMFIMMPLWHIFGPQNSPTESYRVSPEAYFEKVASFNAGDGTMSVKTPQGIAPKGDDAYIGAVRFSWLPNPLVLDAGRSYRLHLSSRDVNHGFSIHEHDQASQKANFQVVPGYEYVLTMTFEKPGVYDIVCQEYCGAGHQFMVGKIIVQQGGH